jgi:hypothetical protein
MKKSSIIIAVILVVALIAATVFLVPKLKDDSSDTSQTTDQSTNDTTTDESQDTTEDTTETPDTSNIPDETPTAAIEVPQAVQQIIADNQDAMYEDSSNLLATGYPSNLIPLYNATMVSESQLITSASGNPGWLTSFVSQNTTEELTTFYRSLMSNLTGFSEETVTETTNFTATSGAYSIRVSISPNIQEKTDLPGNSAASIYIEQIS